MNNVQERSLWNSVSYLLVGSLSLMIAFPLFILVHKQFPYYDLPLHADRIAMFVFMFIFSILLLQLFRPAINIIFAITLLLLGFGSATGTYGFGNVITDYKAMFYTLKYGSKPEKFKVQDNSNFVYRSQILGATESRSNKVRNFAINAANTWFKYEQNHYTRYRALIQSFAIFKKINRKWNYVNDPEGEEYFAPASESAALLAGDCDDHAILMVSAIKSIGGSARFVSTTGHLYPEILIGSKYDLEQMNKIIRELFPLESHGKELHYHTDEADRIWLNLDYTATYPGGKFYAEPVLGILYP